MALLLPPPLLPTPWSSARYACAAVGLAWARANSAHLIGMFLLRGPRRVCIKDMLPRMDEPRALASAAAGTTMLSVIGALPPAGKEEDAEDVEEAEDGTMLAGSAARCSEDPPCTGNKDSDLDRAAGKSPTEEALVVLSLATAPAAELTTGATPEKVAPPKPVLPPDMAGPSNKLRSYTRIKLSYELTAQTDLLTFSSNTET